jgi:hypothetical protein
MLLRIQQGRRKEAFKIFYSTSPSYDLQDDNHSNHQHQQRLEAPQSQPQPRSSLVEEVDEEGGEPISDIDACLRRRRVVQGILAASATVAMSLPSTAARAGIPEIDRSGLLFSPKSEMLAGGTEAARGISLSRSSNQRSRSTLTEGQAFQTVYETRFIAYLSRFLLNFDPAVNAWWQNQGLGESWEEQLLPGEKNDVRRDFSERTFAEFAEAVEIGLADYFVGPYGSYSSLAAAKAGILAAQPALSVQPQLSDISSRQGLFSLPSLLFQNKAAATLLATKTNNDDSIKLAKQGVLNLFTLLKARYENTLAAKRQLAILFSLISSPLLQPTEEIRSLLGEADNAVVSEVRLISLDRPAKEQEREQEAFRTSSRRGGGYSIYDFPKVTIDEPPALGDNYKPAELAPIMQPTSRVLSIKVVDGGEGYFSAPPQVSVLSRSGWRRACQAAAILDRDGHVESILVLDPGYGYGGPDHDTPPTIVIDAPKKQLKGTSAPAGGAGPDTGSSSNKKPTARKAKAVALMEYEIVGFDIIKSGNGYVKTEPPQVYISPPAEDPDWYLALQEQLELQGMQQQIRPTSLTPQQGARALVTEMRFAADGTVAYSRNDPGSGGGGVVVAASSGLRTTVDDDLIERLQRDPLEMLPYSIRPEILRQRSTKKLLYVIPSIAEIPQTVSVLSSSRFRAQDPVFGGIGKMAVSKGAASLRASEYARLALSGAVCTVVVRTALNPLELVKTKQQLQNDDELLDYARQRARVQNQQRQQQQDTLREVTIPEAQGPTSPRGGDKTSIVTTSSDRDNSALDMETAGNGSTAVAVVAHPESSPQETVVASVVETEKTVKIGTFDVIQSIVALRGPGALFQSADITFLASLVFGSFGFGATELFRRFFTSVFFSSNDDVIGLTAAPPATSALGTEATILLAAAVGTVVTAAAASPFEVLRVRSMGLIEKQPWTVVLQDYLVVSVLIGLLVIYRMADAECEKTSRSHYSLKPHISIARKGSNGKSSNVTNAVSFRDEQGEQNDLLPFLKSLQIRDYLPLWSGFAPILSRELPFAVVKFLTFDLLANIIISFLNSQTGDSGALPVQVGVGPIGLTVSAAAGTCLL